MTRYKLSLKFWILLLLGIFFSLGMTLAVLERSDLQIIELFLGKPAGDSIDTYQKDHNLESILGLAMQGKKPALSEPTPITGKFIEESATVPLSTPLEDQLPPSLDGSETP